MTLFVQCYSILFFFERLIYFAFVSPFYFYSGVVAADVLSVFATGAIGVGRVSASLGVRLDSYYELVIVTNRLSIID